MLAIAGGKGGCGKTTTTLGLAAAFVRAGHTALAVDTDCDMPNLHVAADVPRAPTLAAIADGEPVESVAQPPPDYPGVEVVTAPQSGTPRDTVPTALSHLATDADNVLLDCPAGGGQAAALPLRLADRALVVTTPAPQCLRDAAKTAAMARALDAGVVGAVVVRAEEVPSGVERLLDCPVLTAVPDTAPEPLATTTVVTAYDRLASELSAERRENTVRTLMNA